MAGKKQKTAAPQKRSSPKDKIVLPERNAGTAARDSRPRGPLSREQEKDPSEYYRLKRQAVEDLVSANEENSPPVSARELRKYHARPGKRVADWVKAVFLKFWMGGILCYFLIWGLSGFILNQWDHIFILGIAMGLLTNLITNNIYRFLAKTPGDYDRWMMFPGKQLYFLPLDILYGLLLIFCTVLTYNGINVLAAGKDAAAPAVGVEPLLFGALTALWDLLFLGCKSLFRRVLRDAKEKVSAEHPPKAGA